MALNDYFINTSRTFQTKLQDHFLSSFKQYISIVEWTFRQSLGTQYVYYIFISIHWYFFMHLIVDWSFFLTNCPTMERKGFLVSCHPKGGFLRMDAEMNIISSLLVYIKCAFSFLTICQVFVLDDDHDDDEMHFLFCLVALSISSPQCIEKWYPKSYAKYIHAVLSCRVLVQNKKHPASFIFQFFLSQMFPSSNSNSCMNHETFPPWY